MKILVRAHVITAILGWVFVVIMAVAVIRDGDGLVALASLCLIGVATTITMVDMLSVYLNKKGRRSILPAISASYWGVILVIYGIAALSPNQSWQSNVIFGLLIITAFFKIKVSISLFQMKEIKDGGQLI
jgi:hypothetical protein